MAASVVGLVIQARWRIIMRAKRNRLASKISRGKQWVRDVEALETRCLMSGNAFQAAFLQSDIAGLAAHQDPNLTNPWGIVSSPTHPFWINNNGSGTSTVYDSAGNIIPIVVAIPAHNSPTGGTPTGIAANTTSGFKISNVPASFLFATEDGTV